MKFLLIVTSLIIFGCGSSTSFEPINNTERALMNDFQILNERSQLIISDDKEPGQKLFLCLKFIDKESEQVLKEQEVKFYHTSSTGDYEPVNPNDESTARLSGQAFTNLKGRIFIKTILPGNYGSGTNKRHIHTTVRGAKPEAYDIHFKQYTGFMGKNFIDGSDQHFLANLKSTTDGALIAFLTIEVKKPKLK